MSIRNGVKVHSNEEHKAFMHELDQLDNRDKAASDWLFGLSIVGLLVMAFTLSCIIEGIL